MGLLAVDAIRNWSGIDAGFFSGNARNSITVDTYRCLVCLANAPLVRSPGLGFGRSRILEKAVKPE